MKKRRSLLARFLTDLLLFTLGMGLLVTSAVAIWVSTIQLPDFSSFKNRTVSSSTKIYDRTGNIVLYNFHENIRRTEVPFSSISDPIKKATVAIEDSDFYSHGGIRIQSILRAVFVNVVRGGLYQGGSTITQQVVKNSLLTQEKTITRKIKEWILSVKMDSSLPKDTILGLYLNESPYGGNIYGVEEASLAFFGKHAKDVTLPEAAYLAALPQSPTRYSPFGKHRDELEARKNLVLDKMSQLGFISKDEASAAKNTNVVFSSSDNVGGKALHFVFFVREYLENKYGQDMVENGGLKIITTLDYDLQQKAEELTKKHALQNEKTYNASNAGLVAIDPKTGQLLAMVGSRDYFDKQVDGNFNVTTGFRQPGSAFKPIIYAESFIKGYTPETILFDVPIQFNAACNPDGTPKQGSGLKEKDCYAPVSYDGKYRGPVTMREALAQSLNVPAVEGLYLSGVRDSIELARKMGIESLTGDESLYGLSLALGGGEVTLLQLTEAYGVFANQGIRNPTQFVLSVETGDGKVLEKYTPNEEQVLDKDIALKISNILSDNSARAPVFGSRGVLGFTDRDVAVKTGTTNDFRDVWALGFTPSLVVGTWGGNNNNSPMKGKAAAIVIAPLWREFMNEVLKNYPTEFFEKPYPESLGLKPVLRGVVCGGIDSGDGMQGPVYGGTHSILYWVDKNDPRGPVPAEKNDPQFPNWEFGIERWISTNPYRCVI